MAGVYPSRVRDFLLGQVPDQPENVDLRGLLLAKEVEILPDETGAPGYAVYAPDIDIACLWGDPSVDVLDALAPRVQRGTQVVCDEALSSVIEPRLAALLAERLRFFALPADAQPIVPSAKDGSVRVVDGADDVALDHLPEGLLAEIQAALQRTFVAMTFVDDRPVAFCYPHHETEAYWDVSVDTLEAHRRQGHASRAFGVAYDVLRAEGKAPVWGALESNPASSGLAQRLGFEEIAVRYVVIAAGATDRS